MVKESVTSALADTNGKVTYSDFQQAVVAYVDGMRNIYICMLYNCCNLFTLICR